MAEGSVSDTGTSGSRRSVADALRQLLGDSLVYGIGRVAGYLVGIVLLPVYSHFLSVPEYGLLENLFIAATLLGSLVPLGIPSALQRYWFLAPGERDRSRTVGTSFAAVLLLLAVLVPVLLASAPVLCRAWFGEERGVSAFRLAVLSIAPTCILALSLAIMRARFLTWRFGVCSIVQVTCLGVLNTWLVAGLELKVYGVFLGGAISATAAALLALLFVRGNLSVAFSGKRLRQLLAYGVPLVPSAAAFWVLSYADRYLLTRLAGLEEAGLFSAGAKIAGFLFFVNFAAQTAFVPFALDRAGRPEARSLFARSLTGYGCVAACVAVGLTALAPEIVAILTPPEYHAGHSVVPWLTVGLVFLGSASIVNIGIHVVRKTHHVTWVAIVAAVLNVALNRALIPAFGIEGAAAATAVSYAAMTLLYYVVAQRLYPVSFELSKIARLLLLLAVAQIALYLLGGSLIARTAVMLAFPFALIAARVITPAELRALLATFRRKSGAAGGS
jgi:O-antigen/teichoic acid export membrane protein